MRQELLDCRSCFGQIIKTRPMRCFSATAAHSCSFYLVACQEIKAMFPASEELND